MAKKISIKVFADPGHAWARFPKAKLVALGIADKISKYSYQNGINAFLKKTVICRYWLTYYVSVDMRLNSTKAMLINKAKSEITLRIGLDIK